FISSFDRVVSRRSNHADDRTRIVGIATLVAAQLSRQPERGLSIRDLETFFERSLGGESVAKYASESCLWLEDTSHSLVFADDFKRYRLTKLGLLATRAVLPLEYAAGIGQLVRDFLTIDSSDRFLAKWRPLDHLILLEMLSSTPVQLRPFGRRLR